MATTKKKAAPKKARSKTESHAFQAEVAKLLQLMVHSVYSEREVFLRELISNAADACDKLRYEALQSPDLIKGDGDLKITIAVDKAAKTLTVSDNGIGMTHDEMIENLGTIARSGTQAFMEQANTSDADINLIGQFGIGFYSAFMVSGNVSVTSRRAGSKDAWTWTSDGTGKFTVKPAKGDDAPARGTVITLKIRDDASEFLEDGRVQHIITTYSDHIAHPIYLAGEKDVSEQLNSASALWTRSKSDITEDQHKEFFGHVSGSYSDPALTLHYKAEGRNEYTVLLYVPSEPPFDLFDPERRGRQKLYVRRVFITGDAELLPPYLRFVRGVIDSEDMPLNISREMLQDNPTVHQIRKAVTNRVLSELKKCGENDAEKFAGIWKAFGPVIKEGLYEDMERRDQLFEVVRFRSTKTDEQTVSLKDYVANLAENQAAIYYLTGDDAEKAAQSPQLEGFKARGIEVLLLTDPVDSFWVRTAMGFDGKPFKSVTQGTADLDAIPVKDEDKPDDVDNSAVATLIAAMKQSLGDKVKDVRSSSRLTDSPVCLVADDAGLDRTIEKLLAKQGTTGVSVSAPVLEINPSHALIKALADKAKSAGASADFDDSAQLLLDQAYVLEGEPVADPAGFASRLTKLLSKSL
ncbi:MAG: molecular chaperone HtpG [Rhizobiales bacterium]|nr:molecular chaperone HtpG [Hyphomicrobiales bacterium]